MFGGTGNSNSCGRTFERGSLNKGITIRQNGEGPTVETPEKVGHPYYFWGRPRLVAKKTKKSTCRHDRNSWFSVIPEKMCIYIYKYIYIYISYYSKRNGCGDVLLPKIVGAPKTLPEKFSTFVAETQNEVIR